MPKAPGRNERNGISVLHLFQMFPDERSARKWFEELRWAEGRYCGHCLSTRTRPVKDEKPMPYWCGSCRKYFSVKTGTVMQSSNLQLQKWVIGIYLITTSLKGVSSMKLHRDLGITQKTAWFMARRIREGWMQKKTAELDGNSVEVDETYIGGKEGNKHASKKLHAGRGAVGKTAVIGVKDRDGNQVKAEFIPNTKKAILQGFIHENVKSGSNVYTDDFKSYTNLQGYNHSVVKHSVGDYVNELAHINGMESFWSMMKRGYHGTYHWMSVKHLNRYVSEFAGRHNVRSQDTIMQMVLLAIGMVGKTLPYKELTKAK